MNGKLVAISSRDLSAARSWATEFRIPKSYGSYNDLLSDPDIDAVYNPLPNELHRVWVEAAADAGKHVLCEKPLALDADEAEAMSRYCRERGVLLMEAFMWRHQPRTRDLLRWVREDRVIGELRLIRSRFSFSIDRNDWRLDRKRGGGALWDVGCYGISTARLFAGSEPERVQAFARFGPTGVDMSLTAELKFPGNLLAVIDCSFEQPFRCSYELVGENGSIEVPEAYLPPARPIASLRDLEGKLSEVAFDGRNQYAEMVDAFGSAILSGQPLSAPSEDGVAQMRVLDAVIASARANR